MRDSFMGINCCFIDKEWNYQCVLIGFEPIFESHTGQHLGTILMDVLRKFNIVDQVHSITTDNASNNITLLATVNNVISEQNLGLGTILHIPCVAHVIQLALKQLLLTIRLNPTNDELQRNWEEQQEQQLEEIRNQGLPYTLAKVSTLSILY